MILAVMDTVGHFLTENLAESAAQAMDGYLDGVFGQVQARGRFRIRHRALFSHQVVLELLENR